MEISTWKGAVILERFEMNFKNPVVRVWFYTVFPAILVSVILLFVLPMEYHNLVIMGETLIIIIFWIWYLFNKKKKGSN